jgi:hypothetical protein
LELRVVLVRLNRLLDGIGESVIKIDGFVVLGDEDIGCHVKHSLGRRRELQALSANIPVG